MVKKIAWFVGTILVLGGLSATCFFTVEPDEETVLLRFGKYVDTYPPGLHFKFPVGIDEAIPVKTLLRLQHEFGFRTKSTSGRRTKYEEKDYSAESLMLTGDLNVAEVAWVVQFRIAEPEKYLFHTKDPQQNIRDISESVMRRVVGDRSVGQILTVGKTEIETEAVRITQEILDRYDMGVKIITVKLQDVDPPDAVKSSFNEVNAAKQEQEKLINQAEREYNRVIPRAKGRAEKTIQEAQGYAVSVVNRAEGEADKFRAMLAAYRRAPRVTRERMYLEVMEEILQKTEGLTVVDPDLKGLMPLYSPVQVGTGRTVATKRDQEGR